MSDTKINDLTNFTAPVYTDELPVVDLDEDITKKVTVGNLLKGSSVLLQIAADDSVNKQGADYICDGDDDDVQIQDAIDAASVTGGTILLKQGTYVIGTTVEPKSNVTLLGEGRGTIITTSGNIAPFTSGSSDINDIVFDNITFLGNVTEFPTTPQRSRTTSGVGITTAILINGSLDAAETYPVVTNVTIRNCIFKNIAHLPVLINGITGKTIVSGNDFTYTLDPGFKHSQEVIFIGNHCYGSADNGVSLSRGNRKVVCCGNTFENCCYYGIWLAGYLGEAGPTYLSITGNIVRNVGYSGITLKDGGGFGVISGNLIDCQYNRGPSDQLTDSNIYGIELDGDTSDVVNPDTFNEQLVVGNNLIKGASRAGILMRSVKNISVSGNMIIDCGTQYKADGTTAIASSDTGQNIGIYFPTASNLTNIQIFNNSIIDSRGTPYCNYAIKPVTASGVTTFGNFVNGLRNADELEGNVLGTKLGFFSATPVVKQTSGADLTNNVTSGGTNDTIADFTDLSTYANDSAAIRNDIYQLARKVKQINDSLRDYGLLT